MAQKGEKAFRSFIKGLVTEANQLTFPENASVDEANFVLNRDGSRYRRLGIDYEAGAAHTATGLTATQIQEGKQSFHIWDSPAGDTTVSLGIVRIVNKLWFMDMLTTAPSANLKNSGSPITLALGNNDIEVSIVNNKCVIVSKDLSNPVVLSYNTTTGAVTTLTITLEIRDIYGVHDGLAIDNRPTTLSDGHKYNLRNQGWNEKIVTADASYPDALDYHFHKTSAYPSNSDSWTLGKISNASSTDYEKYDPDTLLKNSQSNFQIAKGSFIIDAFNRGASRMAKSSVTGLPSDQETGKISTVTSYAQRLFYSGIESYVSGPDNRTPNYSGYIFFSKVIRSDDDFGICYQEADPTDPGINDLIDTDGGSIQIPEITRIVKIVASQASVLVFAENGVWEVYGDTGGFIATSFQASKISTNGISNGNAVVNVNGNFIYWSKAGIYTLKPDVASGRFSSESISLTSIQTLYLDIPELGKNNAKGFYDEKENRVRFLYNDSGSYTETNYVNKYTKELVFDLTLQSWYKNELSDLASNSPYVADYVPIPGYSVTTVTETVLAGATPVEHSSSGGVIVTSTVPVSRSSQFSFLTIRATSFTLSKYSDNTFMDWKTADGTGVTFSSYLVTGYELFGDIMRQKQIPYLFMYLQQTENSFSSSGSDFILDNQSSCMVQSQWNWADSAAGGNWGTAFQAYRILRLPTPSGAGTWDSGDSMVVTKNKLRGSGKTLSLKIYSETGKDMRLLGWGYPVTMQSTQ